MVTATIRVVKLIALVSKQQQRALKLVLSEIVRLASGGHLVILITHVVIVIIVDSRIVFSLQAHTRSSGGGDGGEGDKEVSF